MTLNQGSFDEKKTRSLYLKKNQANFVPTNRHSMFILNEKNRQDYFVNYKDCLEAELSRFNENTTYKDSQFKLSTSSIYNKNMNHTSTNLKKSKPFETSISYLPFSLTDVIKTRRASLVEKISSTFKDYEKSFSSNENLKGQVKPQMTIKKSNDIEVKFSTINKKEPIVSNRRFSVLKDEHIARHPALVKKCLESKSCDLIREQLKLENNEKCNIQEKNKRHTIYLDYLDKTKNNTHQKLNIFKRDPTDQKNLQNKLTVEKDLIDFGETDENRISFNHLYQQNKLNKGSKTISKFLTRQLQSRRSSPPPPIEISPTGLIPPPQPVKKREFSVSLKNNSMLDTDKENKKIEVKCNENAACKIYSKNNRNQNPCKFSKNESIFYSTVLANKNTLNKNLFGGSRGNVTDSFKIISKFENNTNRAKAC